MDWNFFENIFNGFATLATALTALIIYLYNRRDRKVEAASILLNEINIAEREINNIKQNKAISDYTFIIPSSHWEEFQHLFTKNFDSDELRVISDFFKSCSLAEESTSLLKSYLPIATNKKSTYVQEKLLDLMEKYAETKEYEKEKDRILKIFHAENYFFLPNDPKTKLVEYTQNINSISLTSIGTKLKDIRDAKWYRILI